MDIQYIVWHTAAHANNDGARDTTAAEIDRWHRQRGWKGIGYHYVIRFDGTIEKGRPDTKQGAHVAGLNGVSLGICFSGHGDFAPLTDAQMRAGLQLTRQLQARYSVPDANVIGHREVRDLIKAGRLDKKWHTSKSCPGELLDMSVVRASLPVPLPTPSDDLAPLVPHQPVTVDPYEDSAPEDTAPEDTAEPLAPIFVHDPAKRGGCIRTTTAIGVACWIALACIVGLLMSAIVPPQTETVQTIHVVMKPGQTWDKTIRLSELPDSIDVIRILVAIDSDRQTNRL